MKWNELFVLFGGTTLTSLLVAFVFNSIVNSAKSRKKQSNEIIRAIEKDTAILKAGVQALLKAHLIEEWNLRAEKGYAPIYARQSFEASYIQYHNLGENGVMDDIYRKYMALPIEKPKSKKRLVEDNLRSVESSAQERNIEVSG